MAAYRGTEAYDFSLFEPQTVTTRGSAAPARKPAPARKAAPAKKAAPQKQTKAAPAKKQNSAFAKYISQDERKNTKSVALPSAVIKAAVVVAVFCAVWMGLLVMQAKCESITSQITDLREQMDIAEGEKVRLTAELNSKMSTEKIEDYAVNKLGMVKAESYQINYIDLSEGDKVVVSGGKSLDNGSFALKVKELFAYIF